MDTNFDPSHPLFHPSMPYPYLPHQQELDQELFVPYDFAGYPTPESTPSDQLGLNVGIAPAMTTQQFPPQPQQVVGAPMPTYMTRQQAMVQNMAPHQSSPRDHPTVQTQEESPEIETDSYEIGKLEDGTFWRADTDGGFGREGVSPFCNQLFEFETAELVMTRENPDINTVFETYEEAAEWRTEQCDHDANPNDATIPTEPNEKKALVKLLFKAFKSTHFAQDNDPIIDPFLNHRHDNRRVEAMCWDLLYAVIKRAETGPLLQAYDPSKVSTTGGMENFAERFDAVVDALCCFKTICKHLFDAPYLNVLVDDPNRAKSRVMSNKRLNAVKGDTMKLGKKARAAMVPETDHSAKRRRRNVAAGTSLRKNGKDDNASFTIAGSPVRGRLRTPTRNTRARTNSRLVMSGSTPNDSPASVSNLSPYVLSPDVETEFGTITHAQTFKPQTLGSMHAGHYHATGNYAGQLPVNSAIQSPARVQYFHHGSSSPFHRYMTSAPNAFTGYASSSSMPQASDAGYAGAHGHPTYVSGNDSVFEEAMNTEEADGDAENGQE